MCNIPDVSTRIKKIDCFANRGKITFYLSDKRVIIIPTAFFPEVKKLPASNKREWQVIDGQNFTFEGISEIWGLQDILKLQY